MVQLHSTFIIVITIKIFTHFNKLNTGCLMEHHSVRNECELDYFMKFDFGAHERVFALPMLHYFLVLDYNFTFDRDNIRSNDTKLISRVIVRQERMQCSHLTRTVEVLAHRTKRKFPISLFVALN